MDFLKAKPIWVFKMEYLSNCHLGFKTVLRVMENQKTEVFLACCTMYRIFINNEFFVYGPARGPKGYFRMDRFDISDLLTKEQNIIAIEVLGVNCDTFCNVDQPSFLACEIMVDGVIEKYTGRNDHFNCRIIKERIVKTQRYSFQRGYCEAYNFDQDYDLWRKNVNDDTGIVKIDLTETKRIIERRAPYPLFEKTEVKSIYENGSIIIEKPNEYIRNQMYLNPEGMRQKYFKQDELEFCVTDEAQEFLFKRVNDKTDLKEQINFEKNSYCTFDFGILLTGFLGFDIDVSDDVTLYCLYDEILTKGDVDFLRASCSNVLRLTFKKGTYRFLAFEPMSIKFLKIVTVGASVKISDIHLIEYKHPPVPFRVKIPSENKKLETIYNAAVETYRQNSVDIFMDCPSRERAGWLCDSYFTAKAEKVLTNDAKIETSFLENYLLPYSFDYLPDGMFPCCYPADFYDSNYIPNWAMWLVIELEVYFEQTQNRQMIDDYKYKIYKLLEFFEPFENLDGLLEKLEGWVFVEWSKANELTQDVNYPTNMLYYAMLSAVGRLYEDKKLLNKAEMLKKNILQKSFNGKFFTDNAVYRNGILVNTNEVTEVCQYYAFFFEIATPQTHSWLWNTLVNDFGPSRKENNKYPEIYFANAFIGNYLRIDCLLNYGFGEKVLENIEGYFYEMAQRTGTLWEHDSEVASCNHGFASYIVYWLYQIYGREEQTY